MNRMSWFYGLTVALLFGCSNTKPNSSQAGTDETRRQTGEFPIRWTPHLDLGSLEELANLPALLGQPVITDNGAEKIEMENDKGDRATVTTPRQWLDLRKAGYGPVTTYDIKAEGWFKKRYWPKALLRDAKAARTSFLQDFDLTQEPLRHLPPTLSIRFFGSSEDWSEIERSYAQGRTWGEIDPQLKVQVNDRYSIVVRNDPSEEQNYINLLAWADFDHDGIEDILLEGSNYALPATLCVYHYVVLTRKELGGRLRVTVPATTSAPSKECIDASYWRKPCLYSK